MLIEGAEHNEKNPRRGRVKAHSEVPFELLRITTCSLDVQVFLFFLHSLQHLIEDGARISRNARCVQPELDYLLLPLQFGTSG